jgi:hypothetical protein
MHIEVDQSGKIEQLSRESVITFSNINQYSVLIPKKVKQQVIIYKTFNKNSLYGNSLIMFSSHLRTAS